ncbi:MAG: hypothetical protein AAFR74_07375 [Pseudomonadota bacterium]
MTAESVISRIVFLLCGLLFLAWPLTLILWAATPIGFIGLFFTSVAYIFAVAAWRTGRVSIVAPMVTCASGVTLTLLLFVWGQSVVETGTAKEFAIIFALSLISGYFVSHAVGRVK